MEAEHSSTKCRNEPCLSFKVSQDGKALLDVLQRPLSPGNSDSLTATANYSKAVSTVVPLLFLQKQESEMTSIVISVTSELFCRFIVS